MSNFGLKNRIGAALLLSLLAGVLPAEARAQSPTAGASSGTSSSSPGAAPKSKAEVLALLYKVYDQSYHFGDAVAKLPAGDWKFGGHKRDVFYEKAYAVRASVTALGKPWDQFYKQPDDAALGRQTLSAIHAVTTQMNEFLAALADTPGASEVAELKPMATAVAESENDLTPYVSYLEASAKAPESAVSAAASTSPPAPPATAPSQPSTPAKAEASPAASAPSAVTPAPAQPSAETAAPASPAPAAAPATPAVTPVAMAPADVQALLYKIYEVTFRIGDLAGSLQADKWNLSSGDRAAFAAKLDALRGTLATAEKARSDFYKHPDDAGLAQTTASDLQALNPKLDEFVAALSGTPAATSAPEFKQAGDDLKALDGHLDPYVAFLTAKSQPATSPGGVALETENIATPESIEPLKSGVVEAAPADQEQVKTLLYKAYVPAFRLKDMLAQEHPDRWHASQADRTAFDDASKALSDRIAELEKWRDQFEGHPDSLEAAFETYASLGKLIVPADVVGRLVGQYGNAGIGAEYGQRAEQLQESRDQIEPYLDYLLRHHDHTSGAIERAFVACENQLGYAMRPGVQQAVSMKNINPVFQGRGKSTVRGRKKPAVRRVTKPASTTTPASH